MAKIASIIFQYVVYGTPPRHSLKNSTQRLRCDKTIVSFEEIEAKQVANVTIEKYGEKITTNFYHDGHKFYRHESFFGNRTPEDFVKLSEENGVNFGDLRVSNTTYKEIPDKLKPDENKWRNIDHSTKEDEIREIQEKAANIVFINGIICVECVEPKLSIVTNKKSKEVPIDIEYNENYSHLDNMNEIDSIYDLIDSGYTTDKYFSAEVLEPSAFSYSKHYAKIRQLVDRALYLIKSYPEKIITFEKEQMIAYCDLRDTFINQKIFSNEDIGKVVNNIKLISGKHVTSEIDSAAKAAIEYNEEIEIIRDLRL